MTEKEHISFHLREILESNTFSRSATLRRLLEYLVEHSLAGRSLKEYTISQEFFNKQDDGSTRVYVHNLRKKLGEYYRNENPQATYRLSIPKGQYQVEFFENKKNKTQSAHRIKWVLISIPALVAIVLFYVFLPDENNGISKVKRSAIWSPFIQNNHPVLFVLGDHFFFQGPLPTGGIGMLRSATVNTQADLDSLLQSNSHSQDYSSLEYSYLTKQAPFCIYKLMPYISDVNHKLKLSSELTYNDIRNSQIVYFGSYKSLGLLKTILNEEYYRYTINQGKISYYDSESDSMLSYTSKSEGNELVEYPMVIKTYTFYNNQLMAFLSINDAGNMASLNYFLNPDSLQSFCNQNQISNPETGFKAIFQVKSYDRTDMSIKLLKVGTLEEN